MVHISTYKDAQGTYIIITPALAEATLWRTVHFKEEFPAGYPFTTPGSRETIVDKTPCLGAYALSGIRTHDPLITIREHKSLHHSAPIYEIIYCLATDLLSIWVVNDQLPFLLALQRPVTDHQLARARSGQDGLGLDGR